MLASDAFRVMDRTSRGAITPQELAAGIAWLGVKLSQPQARSRGLRGCLVVAFAALRLSAPCFAVRDPTLLKGFTHPQIFTYTPRL